MSGERSGLSWKAMNFLWHLWLQHSAAWMPTLPPVEDLFSQVCPQRLSGKTRWWLAMFWVPLVNVVISLNKNNRKLHITGSLSEIQCPWNTVTVHFKFSLLGWCYLVQKYWLSPQDVTAALGIWKRSLNHPPFFPLPNRLGECGRAYLGNFL